MGARSLASGCEHPVVGEEAKRLVADANAVLDEFIETGAVVARAVYGLFPAQQQGDDIIVFGEARTQTATLHTLRQQIKDLPERHISRKPIISALTPRIISVHSR